VVRLLLPGGRTREEGKGAQSKSSLRQVKHAGAASHFLEFSQSGVITVRVSLEQTGTHGVLGPVGLDLQAPGCIKAGKDRLVQEFALELTE
jgi:hypothetical protein